MSIETNQSPSFHSLVSYTYTQNKTIPSSPKTVIRGPDNRVYTIVTNTLPTCLQEGSGEFRVIKAEVNSSTICITPDPTKTARVYVPPFIHTSVSLQAENEIFQNIGVG